MMNKPRRLNGSNSMAGGSKHSAMKRPQRGLGVAELERIRLQEEQQEQQFLYHASLQHNVKLQQAAAAAAAAQHSYLMSYCSAKPRLLPASPHLQLLKSPHHNIAAEPPPRHFACNIAHIAAEGPNPNLRSNPPCLAVADPDIAFIAGAIAAPASHAPSRNPYIMPMATTTGSPFDPNAIPHPPCMNATPHFMSTSYGESLFDLQPHPQEHSFFPLFPSTCCSKLAPHSPTFQAPSPCIQALHSPTFQAPENFTNLKCNATMENEDVIHLAHCPSFLSCPPASCIMQSAYNTLSETLSPALQNSMELELPSFQNHEQDMENNSKNTCKKCCLDLNFIQEDYEIASYNATKPPWKVNNSSKDTVAFGMGSSPRDNFLKLGPPTTIERNEDQVHLNMHTNIKKCFEESKDFEESSSHNNMVKANVVEKLDLNLKLSLPNLEVL